MISRAIIVFAVISIMPAIKSYGDSDSPGDIFNKVLEKYKSMQTYKAEGTITTDVENGGIKINSKTSFSILLKKPNLYLISWKQKDQPVPGIYQSGAVWSDGTQPYLYIGIMNAYSKMTTDEMALGSATGISEGAAFTIPSLFLSEFRDQADPFSRIIDPKIDKVEKVGDEDCYVLSGQSYISRKETFWISKKNYIIRKYERSLALPEGGAEIPEITDEQLEEAIKGMGLEVTDENKNNMREMMSGSRTMLKENEMQGSSIEYQENISFPKLDSADFSFTLPESAQLKDSLFGNMFGGS